MKGVIFNLLQKVVTDEYGADTWDDLIEEAGADGAYSSLGNYSDQEIEDIISAAARKTGLGRAEILHWFGVNAMPILRGLYPGLFDPHASSEAFVNSVNEIIHPEVRKLYPDAACPFFHFRAKGEGRAELGYESPRNLIDLAHGFIDGAANLYGDQVAVDRGEPNADGKVDKLEVHWLPR